MADIQRFMDEQPKWLLMVAGLVLVGLIGYTDYVTGDYSILIFYLIPISLVSWSAGRWTGAAIALFSGCARFISDYAAVINTRHLYWNTFEDTVFLLVVAFLIALLRKALQPCNS